jgi:cancer susceptibility candidate protein 1
MVNFTLTAAQLVLDLSVTDKGVILNTIQGSNNPNVLSNVIGTTLKLDELMKLMRNAACDVFPSEDAFCYVDGACEKNYIMETHVYTCMAYFVASHNFAWSRWNHQAGSRTAVFQMRELIEHRKLVSVNTYA